MAGFDSVLGLASVFGVASDFGSRVVAGFDSVFGSVSVFGSRVAAGFDSVLGLGSVFGSRVVADFVSVFGVVSAFGSRVAAGFGSVRGLVSVLGSRVVAGFDSVSVCLSKGLGAPAGSVLLGARDFIAQARRWRKALGGGMRQAGVLAAAGLYALEHHVRRLSEDHDNADHLAQGLRALGLRVEPAQTNIVYVRIPEERVAHFKSHLADRGILATVRPRTRLMTHLDVSRSQIETALQAFRDYPHWDS